MFALIVEYPVTHGALPALCLRQEYRVLLMAQAGYLRRLELRAESWSALAELFLFATPDAVEAAVACAVRREFVALHPACRATVPVLLIGEGASRGSDEVVVLRGACTGVSGARRERFKLVAPAAVLW